MSALPRSSDRERSDRIRLTNGRTSISWRDQSALHRFKGVKDADYRAAGLSYGPRNGPFQTIDELKLVLGVTPAIFERIEPAITVYSGRPIFDPQMAPRAALLALSTMDPANVDQVLAGRSSGDATGVLDPGVPLGGQAFTIRAEIGTPDADVVREAVVRLTDDPAQPYWVLAWR
jgi:general secretion pathway protein K